MEEQLLNPEWRSSADTEFKKDIDKTLNTKYIFALISLILAIALIYVYINNFMENSDVINTIISVVLGIGVGIGISLVIIRWYFNSFKNKEELRIAKSYSSMINADIDRTFKVFRGKAWQFRRVPEITFIENWTIVLSHISQYLDEVEMKEFVEYYSLVKNILDLQEEVNYHVKLMKRVSLNDYQYMKDYKELSSILTKEINRLLAVDISNIRAKLNTLSA